MRSRSRRLAMMAGLLGMGGFLMAGPGTGCVSFIAEQALVAADFCFIFDCQSGILGGTIDPCTGAGSGDNSGEAVNGVPPIFTDCPLGP